MELGKGEMGLESQLAKLSYPKSGNSSLNLENLERLTENSKELIEKSK